MWVRNVCLKQCPKPICDNQHRVVVVHLYCDSRAGIARCASERPSNRFNGVARLMAHHQACDSRRAGSAVI
jgi:hypothetical protein